VLVTVSHLHQRWILTTKARILPKQPTRAEPLWDSTLRVNSWPCQQIFNQGGQKWLTITNTLAFYDQKVLKKWVQLCLLLFGSFSF